MPRRLLRPLAATLLGLCLASLGPPPAMAHSGGLNREGCHTNRKTGGYHCHRSPGGSGKSTSGKSTSGKSARRTPALGGTGPAFRTCKNARAAGYRRMRRGEPGYAPHLDRDNDGIACE